MLTGCFADVAHSESASGHRLVALCRAVKVRFANGVMH